MREHLRLGRVSGVTVGINWSVLVTFALITIGLAAGRFPALFPGLGRTAYVVAGLSAGVVFFASLLAHEVAHALVARRNGVEVEGITLWLFGGVASLRGEPSNPDAELRIAGVGPLVSVALAGVFLVIGVVVDAIGIPRIVGAVFSWLALINLVLAVFNLIPAAPLDGGRILRALLWRRRGDRTSAAITASRAGRYLGWVLVGIGLLDFLYVDAGGLWLMLIGWFLTTAATAEEQQARVAGALAGVLVGDVMSRDPITVPASTTIARFIDEYVFVHRHSTFPVVDDAGAVMGLVTLGRVKQVPPGRRDTTAVRSLACALDDVPVARPDDPIAELLPRMAGSADRRALVIDDGRLVGLVSPTDVVYRLEITGFGHPGGRQHI